MIPRVLYMPGETGQGGPQEVGAINIGVNVGVDKAKEQLKQIEQAAADTAKKVGDATGGKSGSAGGGGGAIPAGTVPTGGSGGAAAPEPAPSGGGGSGGGGGTAAAAAGAAGAGGLGGTILAAAGAIVGLVGAVQLVHKILETLHGDANRLSDVIAHNSEFLQSTSKQLEITSELIARSAATQLRGAAPFVRAAGGDIEGLAARQAQAVGLEQEAEKMETEAAQNAGELSWSRIWKGALTLGHTEFQRDDERTILRRNAAAKRKQAAEIRPSGALAGMKRRAGLQGISAEAGDTDLDFPDRPVYYPAERSRLVNDDEYRHGQQQLSRDIQALIAELRSGNMRVKADNNGVKR